MSPRGRSPSSFILLVSQSPAKSSSHCLCAHHQSGTGQITELAYGKYSIDTVYSDLDVDQIKAIPPTAFHRNVDREVIRADEEGAFTPSIPLPLCLPDRIIQAMRAHILSRRVWCTV